MSSTKERKRNLSENTLAVSLFTLRVYPCGGGDSSQYGLGKWFLSILIGTEDENLVSLTYSAQRSAANSATFVFCSTTMVDEKTCNWSDCHSSPDRFVESMRPWLPGKNSHNSYVDLPELKNFGKQYSCLLTSDRTNAEDICLWQTLKKTNFSSPSENPSLSLLSSIKICQPPLFVELFFFML